MRLLKKLLPAALAAALFAFTILAPVASAQTGQPSYGEGPGVPGQGVVVRELPATGSAPEAAGPSVALLVLGGTAIVLGVAVGSVGRRHADRSK